MIACKTSRLGTTDIPGVFLWMDLWKTAAAAAAAAAVASVVSNSV